MQDWAGLHQVLLISDGEGCKADEIDGAIRNDEDFMAASEPFRDRIPKPC
jgi:hypothetical protein